mgnify:CR=1 FL=1
MVGAPCLMRTRAFVFLEQAGIAWRVVFTSQSLSGIWAAVQAGLGVTLRSYIGLPPNLRSLSAALPSPGHMGIALLQQQSNDTTQQMLAQLTRHAVHNYLQPR